MNNPLNITTMSTTESKTSKQSVITLASVDW